MPYCVKCKRKSKCTGMKLSHDSRGKPRYEGKCASCGTRCFRYASHSSAGVHKHKSKRHSKKHEKKTHKKSKRQSRSKNGRVRLRSFQPVSPMYM